jgi:streptogramin lyase
VKQSAGALVVAALLAGWPGVARSADAWQVFHSTDTVGFSFGIVAGPDGNMWLTSTDAGLVRVDPQGHRTSLPLTYERGRTEHRFLPAAIALGADRKFYMTGCVDVPTNCAVIGVATTEGAIAVYPTPSGESPRYNGLGRGPDGSVWFAEPGHVAKITVAGHIVEYPYPSGEKTNVLSGIASGADGHVWFTEVDRIAAANIDPASGVIVEFPLKPQHIDCGVSGMAAAADGKLYFGCGTGIVAMTTTGSARYFSTGYQLSDSPLEVALGPDGNAWAAVLTAVQQIEGSRSEIVTYVPPGTPLTLYASATAPDGRLWTLCEDGTLYVLTVGKGARAHGL